MDSKETKNNQEIIVGLDIGTTKIVAMVGRRNEHNKIEILGLGHASSEGVERGVVTHISKVVVSIQKAMDEAQKASGVEIRRVNVGIAGQHIRSYQHRGILTRKNMDDEISQPDVDCLIDDMYKLAMPPGEQIIHVLPQEYIVDNSSGVKDPIGMLGNRLEANFHIISGQVTAAKHIYKCAEQAHIHIDDLILEPLASSEAVLSQDEKEMGVVLVDIGGGTTDVAIFHDGIIRHTAVIPFGGNIITEDIRNGCGIIKHYAEMLKIKYGSALPSESMNNKSITIPGIKGRLPKEIGMRNLAEIIQARMTEILEFVEYEIKNSGFRSRLAGGIVVTGGGANLKNITQLTEFVTGLETRVGFPTEHISGANTKMVSSPIYSTSIGLMMMGFDSVKSKVHEKVKVTQHSTKTKGSIWEKLIQKSSEFFGEEDGKFES